jgi:hypothetical protein
MKKILFSILMTLSVLAHAEMTIVVPGNGGWWTLVVPELSKALGEEIVPQVVGGARGIPAGNKWHDTYRFDNNAMVFTNGGQAETYLLENVKLNFKDYEPILAQNQTIAVGYNKKINPYTDTIKFARGGGMNPDVMAITMMVCGPLPTMEAYLECYKKHINYVAGMTEPEAGLAYTREELNTIRENPFDYNKKFMPLPFHQHWFSAGLLDIKTGKLMPDPNYPVGTRSFPEAYKVKWGKEPSGRFYDAWLLIKNYRDVLQKVIWVNKNNPNKDRLIAAARKMLANQETQKMFKEKIGDYPWWIGDDVLKAEKGLDNVTTMSALRDLVWWTNNAYGIDAVLKPEIVDKAK